MTSDGGGQHRYESRVLLLYPDAKKVMLPPDKDQAIGDGRGCHAYFTHRIGRDQLVISPCTDDKNPVFLTGAIYFSICRNRRSGECTPSPDGFLVTRISPEAAS